MPTYDYRCAKCGEDLEVYQSFSEAPLKKHAGCGGKLTKVLSSVGIVLKGSGFYKTDNRDSVKARKAREDSSSGRGESTSSGGSDPARSSDAGSSSDSGSGSGSGSGGSDSTSSSGDSSKSKPTEKGSGAKQNGEKRSGEKKSPVKSA